jgi:PncC family amidohydrolase
MDTSKVEIALVKEIHRLFKSSGARLSVAESCTGGLISHLITSRPGASDFFDSSVVCYSIESKTELLGISKAVIKEHGVISEEVAREMAVAVRKKRHTDFSLATTGNLGPDTLEDKPAGLIYVSVDSKNGAASKCLRLDGGRGIIKVRAAMAALEFLRDTFVRLR